MPQSKCPNYIFMIITNHLKFTQYLCRCPSMCKKNGANSIIGNNREGLESPLRTFISAQIQSVLKRNVSWPKQPPGTDIRLAGEASVSANRITTGLMTLRGEGRPDLSPLTSICAAANPLRPAGVERWKQGKPKVEFRKERQHFFSHVPCSECGRINGLLACTQNASQNQ